MTGSGLLVRLPFQYPSFYSYVFHDYYVSFSLNPFGLTHPFTIILYIFYCYITTHSQSLTPHPTESELYPYLIVLYCVTYLFYPCSYNYNRFVLFNGVVDTAHD
jgi:hypothetical protein